MLDSAVKSWESNRRFVRRACCVFVKVKDTFLRDNAQTIHAMKTCVEEQRHQHNYKKVSARWMKMMNGSLWKQHGARKASCAKKGLQETMHSNVGTDAAVRRGAIRTEHWQHTVTNSMVAEPKFASLCQPLNI